MAKRKITDLAEQILHDYLPEHGYSLYHSEFIKEGRDWYLRIFIDKDEGPMSTADCEQISRFLSDELDRSDPIERNYFLVVSSPGIDRELIKPEHFDMYTGSQVDVSLYKAYNGEKQLTGELRCMDGNTLFLKMDDDEIEIPMNEVSKTRLTITF